MSESNPELGRFVAVNGIRTNYQEAGSGANVLLLHGSGPGVTAYANWRLVIPKLASRFRVIAPDIVGFGYTDRPADVTYGLDYWVEHIAGFIQALDLRRVHLVGNSFGGALSLALATRYPQLVERLVLMGSVGVGFELTPGLDAVWGYRPSLDNMRQLMQLFAHDHSLITNDLIESRYRASLRSGYQESFSRMFPAPRQRSVDAMRVPDENIRQIKQPTLIVHGRDDRVIPLQTSLELHSLIDDSELHVFGRCGHWVQIEQNARFCRLVAEFLANESREQKS